MLGFENDFSANKISANLGESLHRLSMLKEGLVYAQWEICGTVIE